MFERNPAARQHEQRYVREARQVLSHAREDIEHIVDIETGDITASVFSELERGGYRASKSLSSYLEKEAADQSKIVADKLVQQLSVYAQARRDIIRHIAREYYQRVYLNGQSRESYIGSVSRFLNDEGRFIDVRGKKWKAQDYVIGLLRLHERELRSLISIFVYAENGIKFGKVNYPNSEWHNVKFPMTVEGYESVRAAFHPRSTASIVIAD